MSTQMMDVASIGPVSRGVFEKQESLLAAQSEELLSMRFSIVLTAKWASAENIDRTRRSELRADLARMRSLYFDKIDEMAMDFGVQQAMDAKEKVEKTEILPPGDEIHAAMQQNKQLIF